MGIGIQCGITQEQAQIQAAHADHSIQIIQHHRIIGVEAAHNQRKCIHQHHAAKIKQIKPQRTPQIFHSPAQRIIADHPYSRQQNISATEGQRVGKQPPQLAFEDQSPVKAQPLIQQRAVRDRRKQIHHCAAQHHIQHQIGNPLIAMLKAKSFKLSANIFQHIHLLNVICIIIPIFLSFVHNGFMNIFW